ncbi:hypothetical protein COB72_08570 [bacterium]|nr:MAG: hypothetical protein COB72_08570 [bacterium]
MFSKTTRSIHPLVPALAVLLTAFVWQAGANSSRPPAAPTAIATVDISEVINQLKEREVRESELEINMNARQNQLKEVEEKIRILEADLQDGKRGTNEYKDKLRQYMEIQAVYKARSEALNQIVSIDRGTVMHEMYTKVSDAISRIADREGYDIVLFDDSLFEIPEGAMFPDVFRSIVTKSVIYRHDSIDITGQVVNLMNSEFIAP